MSDEIEKVDLANAAKQLRDKIKLGFAEAIDDKQWEAMIEEELTRFTTPVTRDAYGHEIRDPKQRISGFASIAQNCFHEAMKERTTAYVKEHLGNEALEKLLQEWIASHEQEIIDTMLSSVVKGLFGAVGSNLAYNVEQMITERLRT